MSTGCIYWGSFFLFRLIHFWWWEFRLHEIVQWTFPLYFFVAVYATLLYLLCTLIFPEEISDYNGFEDYFYSRKGWIFILMALLLLVDVADTLVKGLQYLHTLSFTFRTASPLVPCLVGANVNNRRFQAAFASFAVLCEVTFILIAHLRSA